MPVKKAAKTGTVRPMPKMFVTDLDVVGLGFRLKRDVRTVLAHSVAKTPVKVTLTREPDNKYDVNAIRVNHAGTGALAGHHLGYIRADSAAILASLMDDGQFVFKRAKLEALYEDEDYKTGSMTVEFVDKRKK